MLPKVSAILLLATATAASAHPRLEFTSPARGSVVKTATKEIRMSFSEELIAPFTGIELKDGKGKPVPTGKIALVPGDSRKFAVPIMARLMPGTYTVAWHAVSVDTHRVSGTYAFKVVQ